MDQRIKETISLYRRGIALAKTREGGHITGDYEIVQDTTNPDGIRTIELKPRDKTEFLKQCKELAKVLAEKVGEGESKAWVELLEDTLIDYREEDVARMHKEAMEGKKPVKTRKGCFEVIIGDGRRKNADIIRLRD